MFFIVASLLIMAEDQSCCSLFSCSYWRFGSLLGPSSSSFGGFLRFLSTEQRVTVLIWHRTAGSWVKMWNMIVSLRWAFRMWDYCLKEKKQVTQKSDIPNYTHHGFERNVVWGSPVSWVSVSQLNINTAFCNLALNTAVDLRSDLSVLNLPLSLWHSRFRVRKEDAQKTTESFQSLSLLN